MNKLPKYIKIIEYYKQEIESGRWKDRQPLPSEEEIC